MNNDWKNALKFGVGLIIVIALFKTLTSDPATMNIRITKPGYMATYSESSLEEAIRYATQEDYEALSYMYSQGIIFDLAPNQEVHVREAKLGKVKIRFRGTNNEVWVLPKALK